MALGQRMTPFRFRDCGAKFEKCRMLDSWLSIPVSGSSAFQPVFVSKSAAWEDVAVASNLFGILEQCLANRSSHPGDTDLPFASSLPPWNGQSYWCYRFFAYFWHHFNVLGKVHTLTEKSIAMMLLRDVRNSFATDLVASPIFHLFGGEQKLMAECVTKDNGSLMSYQEFLVASASDMDLSARVKIVEGWFLALCYLQSLSPSDIARQEVVARVICIQKALKEICTYYDPQQVLNGTIETSLKLKNLLITATCGLGRSSASSKACKVLEEMVLNTKRCNPPTTNEA
ncbi:hypothetical protein SELMODRAFT_404349 [Selaginella moellendorffii]|uniref:Uncharacterized protein n=1 Tax=Selaginella moellendorffii TaxID=88036 RepID=D8QV20_SELML|nr:hypothetical protein SELMODRAFT_404349 [Selaginella moellendorffii]